MAIQWRQVCYGMMAVNAVLMLATLAVAAVGFTQPRVPPSSCAPDLGRTTARARVSSLAPPSTAESDVMNLTREIILQAVKERQNNYQAAEIFRTKKPAPQSLKPFAHVALKSSQTFIRDKTLLWNNSHSGRPLRGFQYDKRGYLHVPEDGYYFIYAHLQYEHKPQSGFGTEPLKDYVFRTEKRFADDPMLCEKLKKKLLFNEQTTCKVVSPAVPLSSSYQGAVVYLRRDDMLSVASCLPENLHSEAERSYFGVYLV